MAYIDNNDITSAIRGRVGPFVFRRVGNKTIVTARPSRTAVKQSPAQKATRTNFSAASRFAKEAVGKSDLRKRYEALAKQTGLTNAYTAAVTDFLNPLEITALYAAKDGAKPGIDSFLPPLLKLRRIQLTIVITVNNPLKVRVIDVTLRSRKGEVIKVGEAVYEEGEASFRFVATVRLSQLRGATIIAKAVGISGLTSVRELSF